MSQRRAGFIKSRLGVAAAALVILAGAFPAWASLGGDSASIQADQLQMQGTRTTKAAESYAVHEIRAGTGTVVREYVSQEGKVFGVAWRGPWLPDLRQLFGGLVVRIGGHVRAFVGRAYVPEMLPSGVRAEDIQ